MNATILDAPLRFSEVAAVAAGSPLHLAPAAIERIEAAHRILRVVVDKSLHAYGITTGVGALADIVIARDQQCILSRRILMSHAVGVGPSLSVLETRAIMAAMVNNFAHGYSGLRLAVVQRIVEFLNAGCTPKVQRRGSVGYITHGAQIGVALIGCGHVDLQGEHVPAEVAMARLQLEPLSLEAKEGLCLVNGSPCATGLACLAVEGASRIMDWADAVAAMTFEVQRGQLRAFDPAVMRRRQSPGQQQVAATINGLLHGSVMLAAAAGRKTQDALSLRGIPQIHGAVRDAWQAAAKTVDEELASATDNPLIAGSLDAPEVYSQANPIGAGLGLAMDHMAIALAELGSVSGSRLERMVNPLISGFPAFLALPGGTASGFMIAQYAAVSLVGENRRLAAPASLDGGSTSGLQEDILCHATPAALKALDVNTNIQYLLAIEILAAAQSYDLLDLEAEPAAPGTVAIYRALREVLASYADDRPLGRDIEGAQQFMQSRQANEFIRRPEAAP